MIFLSELLLYSIYLYIVKIFEESLGDQLLYLKANDIFSDIN